MEAAADAIIVADAVGSIVFWNAAAERIFGYGRDEAVRQALDIIIPERLRRRHAEGYAQVMRTGVTKYGADVLRVPAVHKDGHTLSIAFTVTLMSAAGQDRLIVATVRDETQRWQEEHSLRQRLAALEAANR
ncbi:histidine kinase [Steroidobacter denitrificans]|uniref:Histidine kinase n=1 Tax=Steroidobacter denitrificans TaxID=465721 RepID=A0A127FEL3_STEDE|nr:histidine kinase [Steroidobacter denitrificans]